MAVAAVPAIEVSSDCIDSWEEYWLAIATTVARKSKDRKCPVGAVIVQDGQLVAAGFNGLARDVYDDPALLADAKEKLKIICHAEHNAICNAARAGVRLLGATIYVTKFPCLRCCNSIVQAGIHRVYTHDDKFWRSDPDDGDHTRKQSLLRQAKIDVIAPFHPVYMTKRITNRVTTPDLSNGATHVLAPTESLLNSPPGQGGLHTPDVSAALTTKAKRKKAKPKNQQGLWPAREAIPGGKSG